MHYNKTHFNTILFFIALFFSISSWAQNKTYAKQVVKTLSSPEFHGRGFVKGGDKIASEYIKTELEKWNTLTFGDSYFQYLNLDINTINKAKLIVGEKELKLGDDYLVYASSSSLKGKYELYQVDSFNLSEFIAQDNKNKIFVLDTNRNKSKDLIDNYRSIISTCAYKNAAGIIEVTDRRLIQTQRTYELGFPYLQIKNESWDSTANKVQIQIKNKFKPQYQSQNVIAYIEGEIDSFYVFTAHYDHLGRIGKDVYFPGANDNASGVASVLDLAKHYASTGEKPKYSIAFMLFTAEEAGLIGSLYYSEHPLFPLEKIKFLFNLDMVGTGIEGLSIVNGKSLPEASQLIKDIN
jgi:hypothetical protein